jgi:hypothetical protein
MLPAVSHFMHERLADLFVGLIDEGVGTEREFVLAERAGPTGEAIGREVAVGIGPSLVRYKNVRQGAFE